MRRRLTLVYGGLFLLAGIVLLGATYLFVAQSRPEATFTTFHINPSVSPGVPPLEENVMIGGVRSGWHEALDAVLARGAIVLLLVAVLATALVWLIAGRLLRPLYRVTDAARRIAEAADRGLHERIALEGPADEVKELADTFDVMLARLDKSFDGQRRFIANASHELRTPLALNRALLEVALYRGQSLSVETLLEINARQERLLDGLLLLARSEREIGERSYVDLADIVEHVVTQTKATIDTELGEAPTTGNPALLEQLVRNLVDNAVSYNIPNGKVWVSTSPGATLQVANTGPIVPRYEIPALFQPFRRGTERVRSPGSGLGLSIVEAVARAHGGVVEAEPRDGGGLIVTVTLPAA